MDNWVAEYHLGRLVGEERLRDAELHRRALGSKRFQRIPAVLRAILAVFV